MGKFIVSESFLYKWRFIIGYALIALGLIAALILVGLYLPGGLSAQEMQSVVDSNSVNFNSFMTTPNIINLPYYFLQHAALSFFGVTIFTIKLPSLILAFLSVIGIILILRKWFKPSVGVLASLIAITTGQFLFIAQDGTANIMYLFLPVCLLLLATMIAYQKKFKWFYVLGFFISAALSLYTPLGIYLLLALVIIAFIHPHLRYLVKQISQIPLVIGIIIFAILITPLANALISNPSLGLTLIGVPTSWPNLGSNLASLAAEYFGFDKPGGLTVMTPFFELGSMLIILIGIIHVIRTGITAKNYVIISWVVCLIPLMIFNPGLTSITYLPLVLLLATGLNTTLSYWYKLFPNNPYARIGGLIPVIVLVSALVFSGASRFVYGYEYDPSIVSNFSNDLELIPVNTKTLLVANSEKAFYEVVANHNKNLAIITEPSGDEFLATHKSYNNFNGYKISKIITSSSKDDSNRFYLYTKTAN